MIRPSRKECDKKIREAKNALARGRCSIENPVSLVSEIDELGYMLSDLERLLPAILDEVGYGNYAGRNPPAKSYKSRILRAELWAFAWNSRKLGCKAYFKFALKDDALWIVSFHKSVR